MGAGVERIAWGEVPGPGGARAVELFTLTGPTGIRARVATWGAALVGLSVPDRAGIMDEVVLGFDSLEGYRADRNFMGAVIGRTANRIGGARFSLDGAEYALDRNQGAHHLHGGGGGFHSRVWSVEALDGSAADGSAADGPSLTLCLVSPDGDQGYPGTVTARACYQVTGDGLRLTLRAETDRPTVVNMTGHAYFNLGGAQARDILDHEVSIRAGRYLEADRDQLPTGGLCPVLGTGFDFTSPVRLGGRLGGAFAPLDAGQGPEHGFDHGFVLDGEPGRLNPAARVWHPQTGRVLEVWTTQPTVHFYTGGFVAPGPDARGGGVYGPACGLCLEAQGYTDAPNRPEFRQVTLRPGQQYEQTTEYRFATVRGADDAEQTGGEQWHTSS
jgi:aldose 1-epimerase